MKKKPETARKDGANILICGSQKFEDPEFVFSILNLFFEQTGGNIRTLYTSKFSGSCEYARRWTEVTNKFLPEDKKIKIVDYLFDTILEPKNNHFYEEEDLPQLAIQNSEFFQEMKDKMLSMGINMVLPFPNKDSELGVSTKNIVIAADLAGIPSVHLEQAYKKVKNYAQAQAVESEQNNINSTGFSNKLK